MFHHICVGIVSGKSKYQIKMSEQNNKRGLKSGFMIMVTDNQAGAPVHVTDSHRKLRMILQLLLIAHCSVHIEHIEHIEHSVSPHCRIIAVNY